MRVCAGHSFQFYAFPLGKVWRGESEVGEEKKKRLDDKIGVMRFIVSFLPID